MPGSIASVRFFQGLSVTGPREIEPYDIDHGDEDSTAIVDLRGHALIARREPKENFGHVEKIAAVGLRQHADRSAAMTRDFDDTARG